MNRFIDVDSAKLLKRANVTRRFWAVKQAKRHPRCKFPSSPKMPSKLLAKLFPIVLSLSKWAFGIQTPRPGFFQMINSKWSKPLSQSAKAKAKATKARTRAPRRTSHSPPTLARGNPRPKSLANQNQALKIHLQRRLDSALKARNVRNARNANNVRNASNARNAHNAPSCHARTADSVSWAFSPTAPCLRSIS